MFDFSDPETLWLNLTNIALGLVTLICVVAVVASVVREVAARAHKQVPVFAHHDEHSFILSDLGITMADGGEKIDEDHLHSPKQNGGNNEKPKS